MKQRQLFIGRELPAYVGSDTLDPNADIKLVEEKDAFVLVIGTNKFVGLTLSEATEALQHLEILRHVGGFVFCGKPGKPQRTTVRKASAFPNAVGHRKGGVMVYGAMQPRPSYSCPICMAALQTYLKRDGFDLFEGQKKAYTTRG